MLVLTLTTAISKLHPHDNSQPSPWQLAFLLCGFAFLVVGASGIRPCNLAFGADQFNPNVESGRRGINSFFNWYYFTFTFAMMVSLTVIVYVQSNVSWALGLAIPTVLMFLSCVFFFIGTNMYVKILPEGSPLTSMAQVIVAAINKRNLKLPQQPWNSLFNHTSTKTTNSKLPYTPQFRFLNKAAIISQEDEVKADELACNPWRLCSVQQVEEVKCVLRVFPIWIAGVFYYIVQIQMSTYVVFQALQMDRHLGATNFMVPAASYIVFSMMSLTVWIPIYDRILVPFFRKLTKNEAGITILQKIGVGLFLGILTMLVAAIVETQRRRLALTPPTLGTGPRKGVISSLSGSWLIPQLVLAGLSEAFAVIGQVEFFYKQFPENMRSFAGSSMFCGFAISSYLTSFLISVVHNTTTKSEMGNWLAEDLNKGRLDNFYYLIAALQVLNLGYFLVCAKLYKYKGTEQNEKPHSSKPML